MLRARYTFPLHVCDNKHAVDCVGLLCRVRRRHFACDLQQMFGGYTTRGKNVEFQQHKMSLATSKMCIATLRRLMNAKRLPETTRRLPVDEQPFAISDDEGFCRLVIHMEPRFILPSPRYFSDVRLLARYGARAHTLA